MLPRRHLVELVDAAAALVAHHQGARLECKVARDAVLARDQRRVRNGRGRGGASPAALLDDGDSQARGGGCVPYGPTCDVSSAALADAPNRRDLVRDRTRRRRGGRARRQQSASATCLEAGARVVRSGCGSHHRQPLRRAHPRVAHDQDVDVRALADGAVGGRASAAADEGEEEARLDHLVPKDGGADRADEQLKHLLSGSALTSSAGPSRRARARPTLRLVAISRIACRSRLVKLSRASPSSPPPRLAAGTAAAGLPSEVSAPAAPSAEARCDERVFRTETAST